MFNKKIVVHRFDRVSFLLFSGCFFGLGMTIIFLYIFLSAYLHPSKTTLVAINYYGEAHLELFAFFILLDFFILCLFYGWKKSGTKGKDDETK